MVPDLAIQTNAYSSTMPTVGTLVKGLHCQNYWGNAPTLILFLGTGLLIQKHSGEPRAAGVFQTPAAPRIADLGSFVHWSLSSKFGKFGVSNFGVYGVYRPMNIQIHDFMTHETYQYPSKLPQAAQACTSSSTRACAIAGCPSDDMGCHDFSSYPKSMVNIAKRTQTRWCSPII